jgi:5-formyltetrahydrofolate cyclo-ligase
METKREIRKKILAIRDSVSEDERVRMSGDIFWNVTALPEFQKAQNILLFAGYGSEPDTLSFLTDYIKCGKRIYCPLVVGDVMEFYEVSDKSDFVPGYKGIPEPKADNKKKYSPSNSDFMLVPGTVFDREGNRIGYGKGFYDRYLSEVFRGETAAMTFSFQIVENGRIPSEKTDHKMRIIVTEKEIIRI